MQPDVLLADAVEPLTAASLAPLLIVFGCLCTCVYSCVKNTKKHASINFDTTESISELYYERFGRSQTPLSLQTPLLWQRCAMQLCARDRAMLSRSCQVFASVLEDEVLWRALAIDSLPILPCPKKNAGWRSVLVDDPFPEGDKDKSQILGTTTNVRPFSLTGALGSLDSDSSVQGIDLDNLSIKEARQLFRETYDARGFPVLIHGGNQFNHTFGYDWEYNLGSAGLAANHGSHIATVVCQEPPRQAKIRLDSFLEYCDTESEEDPLYLFDACPPKKLQLHLNAPEVFPEDLLTAIDGGGRGTWQQGESRISPLSWKRRWLVMGAAGSGSRWHVDPYSTSAWNAVLQGSKHWCLFPPLGQEEAPPGVPIIGPLSLPKAPNVQSWFNEVLPDLRKLPVGHRNRPLEIVQPAGTVIFVPSGWWHTVLNLASPTIAYTENFASEANLEQVAAAIGQVSPELQDELLSVSHKTCNSASSRTRQRRKSI